MSSDKIVPFNRPSKKDEEAAARYQRERVRGLDYLSDFFLKAKEEPAQRFVVISVRALPNGDDEHVFVTNNISEDHAALLLFQQAVRLAAPSLKDD